MTLRCCFWPIFTAYNLHIICTKNRLNSLGLEDMCVRNSSSQPDSSVNQKSLKIPHEIIKVYTFPFTIFCLLWLWNNLDFKMFVHQGTITASLGLQYIKGYLLRHHLSTVRLIFQRNDLMKHFWNIFLKGHIRSRNQLLTLRNSKKSYKNPLSTVTLNASCIKANELLSGCTFACMEIAGSRAAQKSSSFWQFIAWFCS